MPAAHQSIRQVFGAILLSCCLVLLACSFYVLRYGSFTDSAPGSLSSRRCAVGSEKARLAVIIFPNAGNKNRQSSTTLIESLKKFLTGTAVNPSKRDNNKCNFVRIAYFPVVSKDKVFSEHFRKYVIPVELEPPLLNPCQIFLKVILAPKFGKNDFEQVLMVDETVKLIAEIDVAKTFLSKRFAVLHQAYPNVKRTSSPFHVRRTYHFSSKMFGGSMRLVVEMCKKIVEAQQENEGFHRAYNGYLQKNRPDVVIYPNGADSVVDLTDNVTSIRRLENQLRMPVPFEEYERDYAKELEADDVYVEVANYGQTAQRIADALQKNYFLKMKRKIAKTSSNNSSLRFVTANCPANVLCGGFGDRLRGLATGFYMAIATDRIFHVEHLKPVNLASYFLMNEHFYGTDPFDYATLRNQSTENAKRIGNMNAGEEFVNFLNGPIFSEYLENFTNIDLISNRYTGLAALFQNRKFASKIEKVSEFKLSRKEFEDHEYPLFISAAFRVVFSRLTSRFQQLFDYTIEKTVGFNLWRNSVKIGVQVRRGFLVQHQSDTSDRIVPEHIVCFTQEVKRIVHEKIRRSTFFRPRSENVVLFLTTDKDNYIDLFRNNLTGIPNLTIFYTGRELNLTLTHLDHTKVAEDDDDAWQTMAKTFLDWYLLTKMDFLIISRSGLSETASMVSLKPTRRFIHWDYKKSLCPFQTYNVFFPIIAGSSFTSL